jgi:lysophospholipase L1-like esterase
MTIKWLRLISILAIAFVIAYAIAVILFGNRAAAGAELDGRDDNWVTTWGASPQPIAGPATAQFNNQTVRMIARISKGGDQIRVWLNNTFGADSLVIGAAHLAKHGAGADIEPGSDHALNFGGSPTITIPPGASVVSDPVDLNVPDLTELAVSIYLPNPTRASSVHTLGNQTTYISGADVGDLTAAVTIPTPTTTPTRYFLSGIEVRAQGKAKAIIALGDSITDGFGSTANANRRWPDRLAERLLNHHSPPRLSVVNEGLMGDRIVYNAAPPKALSRFDRDVIAQTNAAFVILLVGTNDIGFSASAGQAVRAEEIIQAYRQIISRARLKGLKIIGGTLPPFEGTIHFTPEGAREGETIRQAVNEFIRHGGEFDDVVDFDLALRDPSRPTRLLPLYDSGDHLHPNDAGYEAMANAVDLRIFDRRFGPSADGAGGPESDQF